MIGADVSWMYLTEMISNGTLFLYKENLYHFNQSQPIVDSDFDLSYFEGEASSQKESKDFKITKKSPFDTDDQNSIMY